MNKNVIFGIIALIVIAGLCAGIVIYGNSKHEKQAEEVVASINSEEVVKSEQKEKEVKKNIKIFNGNDRPIAVMVDNNVNAQPQSSINSAYIVYEIIVEGNETRLMPVFKGVDDDTIVGPIRSVRHYFLDYMNENDAICSHLGQSPQAESDIKIFKMDDINGQVYDTGKARTSTSLFWRDSSRKAPHNAYTSIGSLKQIAKKQGYKLTSDEDCVLQYTSKEVDLSTLDDCMKAEDIVIPYASTHKVEYKYDEETGRYTRYSKGKLQKDKTTGEDITTKNIIVTFVYNYSLNDGENKGRQTLNNVGKANGYYITNGYARHIVCEKDSRTSATKYTDDFGNEIDVNDGNTFINICPVNADVIIR